MIYFDNNATTPLDPRVREAMEPFLGEAFGNPSATYGPGKRARAAVDEAREQVAALIGARPGEIVFTSCATESINTVIRSAAETFLPERRRLVVSAVEHSATVQPAKWFEQTAGGEVIQVPVDGEGRLDLERFEEAVSGQPCALVSIIWANNETGVISPMEEVVELARAAGAPLHADAVQVPGKLAMDVEALPVAMLSLSAHKLHGPKGVGALYVNRNQRFAPLLLGGGQENGRRSGTENVAGIVGFGRAAELARTEGGETAVRDLRDHFEAEVRRRHPTVNVNGGGAPRLPNTSNLSFPGIDGEALLILLDEAGICCSPGSACSSGARHPSAVLTAMGFSKARAKSSVRFSLSRFTTRPEVEAVLDELDRVVRKIREVMPQTSGPVVRRS